MIGPGTHEDDGAGPGQFDQKGARSVNIEPGGRGQGLSAFEGLELDLTALGFQHHRHKTWLAGQRRAHGLESSNADDGKPQGCTQALGERQTDPKACEGAGPQGDGNATKIAK